MFSSINPSEWGRHTEKLDQALARLASLERRQDSLVLAVVAGLFAVLAAIVGAVLLAVMSG
jgi:integral membrane sensor domain MASE1